MVKKFGFLIILPIVSALIVFLFVSGIINPNRFDFSAIPYYLPTNRSVTIEITSEGFVPKKVIISQGAEVTFINKDTSPHHPASNLHPTHSNYPEFDSKKGIEPGKSWKVKLNNPGIWFYHDHLRPEIGGKIKIVSFYGDNETLSWTKEQGAVLMRQIEMNESSPKRLTIARTLARKVGPEIAIELLNESPITKFGETHLVAHVIGEVAYELYEEKALPVCQNDELNGCSHGVVLTAISDIGLDGVRSMIKHCETLSTFKNQMCLHATGHALAAEYNYDIFKAVETCDQLGNYKQEDIEHCYIGAFMENVLGDHNGLDPSQHPYLSQTNQMLPCDQVLEKYQSSCFLNQATWWYRINQGDIKKTAQNCNLIPQAYQLECADNIGRIISTATKNELNLIKIQCGYMNEDLSNQCIGSISKSVFALGDEKLPFTLCTFTSQKGKEGCFTDLYSLMILNSLSNQKMTELCNKFENNYQYVCQKNTNK